MFDFIKKFVKKESKDAEHEAEHESEGMDYSFQDVLNLTIKDNISLISGDRFPLVCHVKLYSQNNSLISVEFDERTIKALDHFKNLKEVTVAVRREGETLTFRSNVIGVEHIYHKPVFTFEASRNITTEKHQRKHMRYRVNLPAKINILSSLEQDEMVHIKDLSLSGISIISQKPVTTGSKVNVKFLTAKFPMDIEGVVTRCCVLVNEVDLDRQPLNYNIGVKFDSLNEVRGQMLSDFVYNLQRQAY
jgi:c-di-GMP-binding flagellar brake protein YcgR